MKIEFDKIKTKLSSIEILQMPSQGLKISSVIMPFYITEKDQTGILLTKRSEHLKSHAGQISFPGGKYDESDNSILDTALREWEEETGETKNNLEVYGAYHSMNTGTGYHITPFISLYKGNFNFDLNKQEVDSMIHLELQDLSNAPFYSIHWENHPTGRVDIYYFDLPQGLLWGATCFLLYNFLKEFCDFTRTPILVKSNLNSAPFFQPPKKT